MCQYDSPRFVHRIRKIISVPVQAVSKGDPMEISLISAHYTLLEGIHMQRFRSRCQAVINGPVTSVIRLWLPVFKSTGAFNLKHFEDQWGKCGGAAHLIFFLLEILILSLFTFN